MYEIVAGKRPFDDENLSTVELLQAVVGRLPSPLVELCPDIPLRLDDLNRRLLAKRPDERPTNAQEVADEIEYILHELRGENVSNRPLRASAEPQVVPMISPVSEPPETLEMPVPPQPSPPAARMDDAFGRETLDLPINTQ